jgi:hypothetical protein
MRSETSITGRAVNPDHSHRRPRTNIHVADAEFQRGENIVRSSGCLQGALSDQYPELDDYLPNPPKESPFANKGRTRELG